MNNHLTDRQILDARFKLCTDAQADAVNAHLAECADCRNRADALKQKFTSLDLLRGGTSASEQLIAETLRQVRNEPEPKTILLPRLGWLAGTAAAAALVVVFFAGPLAKQPEQLAMTREAAAPAVQMAMKEEPPAENANLPTASDIADKDVNEPAVEALVAGEEEIAEAKCDAVGGQLAMAAPKPAAGGTFALKRSAVAMKALRAPVADGVTGATYNPSEWSIYAPADVTVSVHPALVEFDPAVQKLKKGDGMTARQYSVQIINASPNIATAQITRSFGTTNWSVSAADSAVRISTQDEHSVALSIEAPAESTKSFHCTVILPAEPAKGVVP